MSEKESRNRYSDVAFGTIFNKADKQISNQFAHVQKVLILFYRPFKKIWGDSIPLMFIARIFYNDIPVMYCRPLFHGLGRPLIGRKVFKIYNLRLLRLEKSFIYICHLNVCIHNHTVYYTQMKLSLVN
jgi:hypothetical protein